jgi:two-component system sensor histidine kinase BaeS
MKLRGKLIVAFIVALLVMGIVQAAYFHNRIVDNFDDYVSQNVLQETIIWNGLLAEHYKNNDGWGNVQSYLTSGQFIDNIGGQGSGGAVQGGKWQGQGGKGNPGGMGGFATMHNRLEIVVADATGTVIGDTDSNFLGQNIDKVAGIRQDIMIGKEKIGEAVYIQRSKSGLLTIEQQFQNSMIRSVIVGLIISLIVAILLSILFSSRMTQPLNKLLTALRRLAEGDHSYRIELGTEDEFQELANSFNEMSAQLAENETNRKNLLADVAHELRTPISIIAGELELVQEGTVEPDSSFYISLADEVQRLNRLVDDLQQLSLAEAGQLSLKLEETNLYQLLEKVADNFAWAEEEKGINISLEGDKDTTAVVDSDRIKQVIINLIGNAVRILPAGGMVRLNLTEKPELKSVEITIADNGPGIGEEQLKYIFDRFYRTDSSRSRDDGGTGLGLSIVKGYVEAHDGTIKVESELNKGTRFIILLPK